MEKITSFTDLHAWRVGHQFVLAVYKMTRQFPPEERFALANQLQRAVVGITSNVAEGFSRAGKKEKEQFYSIALGSLTEAQNQLLIARDLGYMKETDFREIADLSVRVSKLLHGLKKSAKNCERTKS